MSFTLLHNSAALCGKSRTHCEREHSVQTTWCLKYTGIILEVHTGLKLIFQTSWHQQVSNSSLPSLDLCKCFYCLTWRNKIYVSVLHVLRLQRLPRTRKLILPPTLSVSASFSARFILLFILSKERLHEEQVVFSKKSSCDIIYKQKIKTEQKTQIIKNQHYIMLALQRAADGAITTPRLHTLRPHPS